MSVGTSNQQFKPAWWLPGGHSQTLWRKLSPPASISQQRQRIELDDGDFIDLDWARQIDPANSTAATIVIIQHGLCGCSSSPYVVALQSLLATHGFASAALNFRGCSGEMNRLAKAYHSGISEDTNEVFNQLLAQFPEHKFVFVGYSLGANVLLKWLGEIQHHSQISKAIAVSTPFSLELCARAMLSGVSQLYGNYFVRRLLREVANKKQHLSTAADSEQFERLQALGDLQGIRTIWEFDDRVTAPLHGFEDAIDYYTQCSSAQFIEAIGVDTLLIQSSNDPMIPPASVPDARRLPSHIHMQLLDHGGHVGFISAQRNNWLEQRIVSFVLAD